MDRFDFRSELVRALKGRGKVMEKAKDLAHFCCIRHEDRTPSAWIGEGAWGCYSCNFTESLDTLADALGVEKPTRKRGLTLEEYAERKGLTIDKLQKWGVRTATGKFGEDVVAIPYHAADGTLLRTKHRVRPSKAGGSNTFWAPDGTGTHLYGLSVLAKSSGAPVLIVEGESDCHAAWTHGVVAVGVPGKDQWKPEWATLLAGRAVYVWQEPDGASLVQRVAKDLPTARIIDAAAAGVKDVADLHLAERSGFKVRLTALMEGAQPIGAAPPVMEFDAIVGGTLDRLLAQKLEPIDAVPTPFPSWNQNCRDAGGGLGLARGWHITLGGNPGFGKSLIAVNLSVEAVKHGETAAYVSLEMSQQQLTTRYLAALSGMPIRKLEQGADFDPRTWSYASQQAAEWRERTGGVLRVNRRQLGKLSDVVSCMQYEHEYHGARFFIVDYLQLAWIAGRKNLFEQIQEVSHTVRDTAVNLDVVSIGLSQYNRETAGNYGEPPTPQGLMGGSPLENDSDQVVLLDHSDFKRDKLQQTAQTKLLLAKNRHGGPTEVPIEMNFRNLEVRERGSGTVLTIPPSGRGEAWEPEEARDAAA